MNNEIFMGFNPFKNYFIPFISIEIGFILFYKENNKTNNLNIIP
jgi:hypothetical protein